MTELWVLVLRHLRDMTRGRLARTAIVLFMLGITLAAWLGARSDQAAALMLLTALLVLTALVAGAALGAAGALPEDRIAGREEWLSTLAPPAWKRRLSAALAGWLLAVVLGGIGGMAAGVSVALLRPDIELRRSASIAVGNGVVLEGQRGATGAPKSGHWWGPTLDVDPAEGPRTLEVAVRPRFRSMHMPVDRVQVGWRTTGVDARAEGTLETSVRGPIRIELPARTERALFTLLTPHVALRVDSVHVLGAPTSPIGSLLAIGLLLGVLIGCVAPVAVFVSRQTTGQTAAAAACCLLLFGTVKGALLTLAADLELGGAGTVASAVLRGFGLLAPDTPLLTVFGETTALRASVGFGVALPALVYGAVALALVALPAPHRFTEGTNA